VTQSPKPSACTKWMSSLFRRRTSTTNWHRVHLIHSITSRIHFSWLC